MVEQGPKPDYAITTATVSKGIEWYLDPVIADLEKVGGKFKSAHAEVAAAHDSEAAGWFPGEGNGRVRYASSSFLNAAEWQLRQLVAEQDELNQSIREYREALVGHLNWITNTEDKIASRFQAIARDLEEGR
jgi:hypothetical protein